MEAQQPTDSQANHEAETETFKLEGDGYALIIPAAAEKEKEEIVSAALAVTRVTNNDESALAQFEVRKLARIRLDVEKARVKVQAPVLALQRKINSIAKEFLADVERQESRLKLMVSTHAEEVEKARLAAEREERRKAKEAAEAAAAAEKAKRDEEEAKQKAATASSTGTIRDAIEAKRKEREAAAAAEAAENERIQKLSERREASATVMVTKLNDGVRFTDDFEVTDIAALYAARPDLVSLSAKTNEVKRVLKEMREAGETPELPGLRTFRKPVVSTR